ncbi:hypothetical protein OVA11_14935 [Caulobacter sp. SL161]|uniref:hypothetical protein n=1 Tax=Caulobacter sp. SL161 TaxID=2995156 RepID=UPI002275BA6A|nr:hypothetical protein [Caulobacter sp. SL161]MCY1648312.1 hypothetical protein [Caulobacter sp. SL161]
MKSKVSLLAFAAAFTVLGASSVQASCSGAGVITRINGKPQDVIITRAGAPVARPRVLDVVCDQDVIKTENGATVLVSLDGAGKVTVGAAPYTVKGRAKAQVSHSAYSALVDHLMPDMKRQPWDVRLRGGEPPLDFAVASLSTGGQQLTAGRTQLLVRLIGGTPGYKLSILSGDKVLANGASADGDVALATPALAPGDYVLKATDAAGAVQTGKITVVADAPPTPAEFKTFEDLEVQQAATAADLARVLPDVWSFEAEQILHSAPLNGLDRGSVYRLIESYAGG